MKDLNIPTGFINQRFTSFEDFCTQINGWNLDFRQLAASTGQHQLIQFTSPELVCMRTLINSHFDQRGSTPSTLRTFNLLANDTSRPSWCQWPIDNNSLIINPRYGEFTGASVPGFELLTFSIDEEMLREITELQFGISWSKLHDESGSVIQLNDNSIACLRETLHTINRELLSSPDRYQSLNAEYFSHLLGQQVVEAIVASKPIPLSKPDKKRRQVLSSVLNYIEANHDELLSIKQLCNIAGTSQRTLEYIFQDKYQLSPKAFLTARRLHATRQLLLQSPQKENRIVDIANQNSFWHMGQFAKDYRSLYGELPSDTLKKACR